MYDHVEIWLKIYADSQTQWKTVKALLRLLCRRSDLGLHCLDQSDLGLHCLPKTVCPIR